MVTIKELLGAKYHDFMEYCIMSGKVYPVEISSSDYVAFRVKYGVNRNYVNEIRDKINNVDIPKVDDSVFDVPKKEKIHERIHDSRDTVLKNTSFIMKEAPVSETIKSIDDDADMWDNSGDEPCIIDAKEKKGKDDLIPYNVCMPLYVILQVNNPEKYSDISIDAMGFEQGIELILKREERETVLDVIRCSIVQLFDSVSISQRSIANFVKHIKNFLLLDVDSVDMKLQQANVSLYKLFKVVDLERYSKVSIESVAFSTRVIRALKRNKINTMYELLQRSIEELQNFRCVGINSMMNLIVCLDVYFKDLDRKVVLIRNKLLKNQEVRKKVTSIVDAEIKGEIVSHDDLDEHELMLYLKIKEAINDCGEEFYTKIKNHPVYAKILAEELRNYYTPILEVHEKKNKIFTAYYSIPLEYRNKSVKFLYKIYALVPCRRNAFLDKCNEQTTLFGMIDKMSDDEVVEYYDSLRYFLQWIKKIDVKKIAEEIFSYQLLTIKRKINEDLSDKYQIVLEMRAEGATFDSIGALIDSTRERARQIVMKYTRLFVNNYKNNEYDLLAIIYALYGRDDHVLCKDEVKALIGEKYTNLLWLILLQNRLTCSLYKYLKAYDLVIFFDDNKSYNENIECALNELPEMFLEYELEKLINDLAQKNNVSKRLIVIAIKNQYKKYGIIYSQFLPTVAFMCRYILKVRFPNGFKTGDADEAKRFQAYLIEFFGEKRGRITARALDAKIGEVGILCDRGKYIHPDYLQVEKSIIDEINAYIEASEKTVIAYSELFDELRTVLCGSQITNRFILQGALKFYGCKYILKKDYITKDNGKNLTDEFENFAKRCGEFHKTDFFTSFPSLKDVHLAMLIRRCPNVFNIDNGYYMHSSLLNLTDQDYDDIKKYLDGACSEGPLNARYLFEEFSYRFIDFMSRNEISNRIKLFGILNYMFSEEFVFSHSYIAKDENALLTNKDVLLHYLEGVDTIMIEDVIAMCQDRDIRFLSYGYLFKQISPDFIRVNETTLMRYELTGLNDDIILEIVTYIADRVETDGYCSVATIKDFLWFPTIRIEWTPYLVEGVMALSGDLLGCINIPTTNISNLTSIYVRDEFLEDDYTTFMLKIVNSAYKKGYFTSRKEIREFLSDKGLINNNNLPDFLEETACYCIDKNGNLQRRN